MMRSVGALVFLISTSGFSAPRAEFHFQSAYEHSGLEDGDAFAKIGVLLYNMENPDHPLPVTSGDFVNKTLEKIGAHLSIKNALLDAGAEASGIKSLPPTPSPQANSGKYYIEFRASESCFHSLECKSEVILGADNGHGLYQDLTTGLYERQLDGSDRTSRLSPPLNGEYASRRAGDFVYKAILTEDQASEISFVFDNWSLRGSEGGLVDYDNLSGSVANMLDLYVPSIVDKANLIEAHQPAVFVNYLVRKNVIDQRKGFEQSEAAEIGRQQSILHQIYTGSVWSPMTPGRVGHVNGQATPIPIPFSLAIEPFGYNLTFGGR